MSIASLDKEISQARAEFTRLNAGHWTTLPNFARGPYRRLPRRTERRIVALAECMARLFRFRSECFARNYASDSA